MPDNESRGVRDADLLWRLSQRMDDQRDHIIKLERRLEEIASHTARRMDDITGKADQAYFVAEILRTRVDSQEQRSRNGGGGQKSILQDSAFVRGVIAVLITGLLAFATGRFFDLGG